ncbi:MAG: hypothetical protein KDI59_07560 [Xanthomonadales bacterium]|nr:hypothetical protein [Xanthomonadales bacterium]
MRYLNLANSGKIYNYKIADCVYRSDLEVQELEYSIQALSFAENQTPNKLSRQIIESATIYSDDYTPVGENYYNIQVSYARNSYQLTVNQSTYFINQKSISSQNQEIDKTILLGPALCLNLAMNNVFCLHSSAFKIKETTFVLMAESGTGKSTIARYFHQQKNSCRIADDILPLKVVKGEVILFPQFPQLKLSSDEQYHGENLTGRIVLLFANKNSESVSLTKLQTFDAAKNLIKHTVASRLFSQQELANHMDFCHKVASDLPAFQLTYPHQENSLKQLSELLNEQA